MTRRATGLTDVAHQSSDAIQLKLSVGSGIEDMASNPVRPIITVHLENLTDRLADCPTGSRSMSK